MKIELIENQEIDQELLPQVIERIYAICKTDPNFELKDDLQNVESQIEQLQAKISKQDELLRKSEELTKDIIQRSELLDSQNEGQQLTLLELLGGEI